MIRINKKVGETPLELLNRVRQERPEFAQATLSYAGRLDPMAEGEMLILVNEENKEREKFLALDKEYIATFLVGISTDSGDILGLPQQKTFFTRNLTESVLTNAAENLKTITEQKYPWFSGRTVGGTKLFDLFKAGNTDIERPTRKVQITEAKILAFKETDAQEIKKYIFESIEKVNGDFRQEKILEQWQRCFEINQNPMLNTFEIRFRVSSGTFIRALTENFGFPVTLLRLQRTAIHMLR